MFEFPLAERIPGTFIYSLAKHILTGLSTGVCPLLRTSCRRNREVNRHGNEQIRYVWLLGTETLSFIFFPYSMSARPGPPCYRGFTITFRNTTFGRTPLVEWSAQRRDLYLTTHYTQNREISVLSAGFEPTILASERPQTHALDRAVTGWGVLRVLNE